MLTHKKKDMFIRFLNCDSAEYSCFWGVAFEVSCFWGPILMVTEVAHL